MQEQQTEIPNGARQRGIHVLAIIVVYKQDPFATASFRSLLNSKAVLSQSSIRLKTVVWDNTPGGQDVGSVPEGVLYLAAPENSGLATAYNDALRYASKVGCEWLLTLDQDTHLPITFLERMASYAAEVEADPQIAVVVPQIADHGRIISPFRFLSGFWPRVLPSEAEGVSKPYTSALNSAALFRVRSLLEVGGYDEQFPLHNSDTRMFQRLDQAGKRVFVARDVEVDHELAILQRQDRMSTERYRSMLEDECDFWDRHMGMLGRGERLLRLAGRVCKGILTREDPTFRKVARAEVMRRLTTRRRARLRTTSNTVSKVASAGSSRILLATLNTQEDRVERMPLETSDLV